MTATLLKSQLIAINARELSQILGDALRIIPSRPSTPMIGCVFIEAIAQLDAYLEKASNGGRS